MTRLERQLDTARRARLLLPQSRAPYHAHLRLRVPDKRGLPERSGQASLAGRSGEGAREIDILLGGVFRRGEGVTIVDWRTAPLAEIFFGYAEGEEYEIDLGDRRLSGVVVERNLVTFQNGELVELEWPKMRLVRDLAGFREAPVEARPSLRPRDPGLRARPPSPVDVELDAAQRAVVELPERAAVLVLGEAGCGKTTVALHRLRKLATNAAAFGLRPSQAKPSPPRKNERFRAACVVPNEGLRLLIESLLHRLGLDDVETYTYDKFASKQARRAFPDLRRRESEDEGPLLSRLKRHKALLPVLRELARRPVPKSDEPAARNARREDLQALYGDPALMEEVVRLADGALPVTVIKEALDHTRVQFTSSTEREHAHVDADRLIALDGRSIDESTPDSDAETVDPEDYAVMFELERLRAERFGETPLSPSKYHCLLIDEAQELAPLELALLGRCVARGGTLIVAGDAAQQVDAAACFESWDETMRALGCEEHVRAALEISYRCPPEVTTFARGLRSDTGSSRFPLARFREELHLAAWLTEALRDLDAADPSSASAVICRTPGAASLLARVLRFGVPARLALEGKFVFGPGVSVTCVPEVKGLEFDHVVLPDVSRGNYADAAEARRALYVAATRASAQLLLAAAAPVSPLIASP